MTNCSFFHASWLPTQQMENAQVGLDGRNLLVAGFFSVCRRVDEIFHINQNVLGAIRDK
jgi:hypothetical protein